MPACVLAWSLLCMEACTSASSWACKYEIKHLEVYSRARTVVLRFACLCELHCLLVCLAIVCRCVSVAGWSAFSCIRVCVYTCQIDHVCTPQWWLLVVRVQVCMPLCLLCVYVCCYVKLCVYYSSWYVQNQTIPHLHLKTQKQIATAPIATSRAPKKLQTQTSRTHT